MKQHVSALAVSLLLMFVLPPAELAAGQREILIGANSIAGELKPGSVLAVVDFTDLRGGVTELGRFIAEEMALGLASSGKGLSVIDRTHLKMLMQEHKLNASGLIDPTTARKLGQIAGVQGLVTGTITPFADSVRVVVKVLDTETARIITATSLDITKNRTIEELLGRDLQAASGSGVGPPPPTGARPDPAPISSQHSVQNGRLRVSINQLSVTENNSRATVSLTLENVSKDHLLLGVEQGYTDVRAALSDDRGTEWRPRDAKGIAVINQMNDLARVKDTDLTPLGPSERLTLILAFENAQGSGSSTTPGSTFSVTINGLLSLGSGARRIPIGVPGIRPGLVGR